MLKDALKLLADKYVRGPDQNETEPPRVSEETGKEGRIFFRGGGWMPTAPLHLAGLSQASTKVQA